MKFVDTIGLNEIIFARKLLFLKFIWLTFFFFYVENAICQTKTFSTIISPTVALDNAIGTCATPGTSTPNVFYVPVSGVGVMSPTNMLLLVSIELNDCGTTNGSGSFAKNFDRLGIRLRSPSGTCLPIYGSPVSPGLGGLSSNGTGTHFLNLVSSTTCLNNPNTSNDNNAGSSNQLTSGNYGYFNAQWGGTGTNYTGYLSGNCSCAGNADGNWTLIFSETSSSLSPCVASIRLVFGEPKTVMPSGTQGETCGNPIVWDGTSAICATTKAKSGTIQMPGSLGGNNSTSFGTIGGQTCNWNQRNNNEVWIKYTAKSKRTCLSISGIAGGGINLQSIVVTDANIDGNGDPCSLVPKTATDDPNWKLISCPTSSIYSGTSGTAINQQHCFDSEINKDYYLVVDGEGGSISKFWIWGTSSTTLPALLPTEYFKLTGFDLGNSNQLKWDLQHTKNVSAFHIQRATEKSVYNDISVINVNSNSSIKDYSDRNVNGGNYFYQILARFTDGTFAISNTIFLGNASTNKLSIFPNPGSGIFTVSGMSKGQSHQLRVLDITGKLIQSANTSADIYRFNMTDAAPGVYFIHVDGKEHLRFVNMK